MSLALLQGGTSCVLRCTDPDPAHGNCHRTQGTHRPTPAPAPVSASAVPSPGAPGGPVPALPLPPSSPPRWDPIPASVRTHPCTKQRPGTGAALSGPGSRGGRCVGVFEDNDEGWSEGTQGRPLKSGHEGLPGLWTEPWDQQPGHRD